MQEFVCLAMTVKEEAIIPQELRDHIVTKRNCPNGGQRLLEESKEELNISQKDIMKFKINPKHVTW